ncbi:hypothetical protein KEJ34_08055, partial [Candidatus Bathyarchaeota archaeon]|nr:hypothetical protein [Candidatus Bathyarchaeota archaeon]
TYKFKYIPIGGVGSDAELHNLTLEWLNQSLVKEERLPKEPTVIFSHHPIWINYIDAFSGEECEKIHAVIRKNLGSEVVANFAGHVHKNKISKEPWFTVVTTDAIYATAENIIRIVKVDAKTKNIDYSTLESVEWEGYSIPYKEYAGSSLAVLQSPGELRIYDEQDRVTGWVNGALRNEIPDSTIYENTIFLLNIRGPYKYEVKGISGGYYILIIANFTRAGDSIAAFTASNITTTENSAHQYIVDWATLSQGEEGVSVKVDSDGDGFFEHVFTSDSELTQSEFLTFTSESEFSALWINLLTILIALAAVIVLTITFIRRKQKVNSSLPWRKLRISVSRISGRLIPKYQASSRLLRFLRERST